MIEVLGFPSSSSTGFWVSSSTTGTSILLKLSSLRLDHSSSQSAIPESEGWKVQFHWFLYSLKPADKKIGSWKFCIYHHFIDSDKSVKGWKHRMFSDLDFPRLRSVVLIAFKSCCTCSGINNFSFIVLKFCWLISVSINS